MGRIGIQEILLVLGLALLIFGPSKIPEIGKLLGRGMKEFRQASRELKDSVSLDEKPGKKNSDSK